MEKSQEQIDQEQEEVVKEPQRKKSEHEEQPEQPPKKGTLTALISPQEKTWRNLTVYQSVENGLEPMASFIRNKVYNDNELRTPQALSQSCEYLLSTILALLDDPKYDSIETIEYIVDRLRAIRCQYHVQNVMPYEIFIKLVKFYILAFGVRRDTAQLRSTLDSFISADPTAFHNPLVMLTVLLLAANQSAYLQKLAQIPDQLLEDEEVQRVIGLANVVQMGDFGKYFSKIRQLKLLQGLLMSLFLDRMRMIAIRAYAKTQLTLSIEYLRQQLYFDRPSEVLTFLEDIGYAEPGRQEDPTKVLIALKKPQSQIGNPTQPTKLPSLLNISATTMMKYINDV